MEANNNSNPDLASQVLYHGTRADLKPGDLISAGFNSNYGMQKKALYVYLSATLEAATWAPSLRLAKERKGYIL